MSDENQKYDFGTEIPFDSLKGKIETILSKDSLEATVENLDNILVGLSAFLKARVFDTMGFTEEAEKNYKEEIQTGSPETQAKASLNLGIFYFEKGRELEANGCYQKAIKSDSPEIKGKAYYCLGELYSKQGEKNKARTAYKEAEKIGNQQIKDMAGQKLGKLY